MASERLEKALSTYRSRYKAAKREDRSRISYEFCQLAGYHRKYAITLTGRPPRVVTSRTLNDPH